eukprot:scaffold136310_cov72-Phaeocystis_antarctica.AAC.1
MFGRHVSASGGAGVGLLLVFRAGGTSVSDASEARCVACEQISPTPQSQSAAARRASRTVL